MTTMIKPIFERDDRDTFAATRHRFSTLFQPIQATKKKESDFTAYVLTPFIDAGLEAFYALDASIHLLNATVSLARALYLWTLNQQKSAELIDRNSGREFSDALDHSVHAISTILSQTINTILSALAWVTRPIASLVAAAASDSERSEYRRGEGVYQPYVPY